MAPTIDAVCFISQVKRFFYVIAFGDNGQFAAYFLIALVSSPVSPLFCFHIAVMGRTRVNSESHATSRDEEFQARGEDEAGTPTDGAPFRGRSKSAPPALWAAKKYGRQLRRMSDEFDSLLDRGVRTRGQRVEDGVKRSQEKNYCRNYCE